MRAAKSPLESFERHVRRTPDGCWIWAGPTGSRGYGRIIFRGNVKIGKSMRISAHRFSYEHFKGPIGDLWVLHRCDVRLCVNPNHLFLGTCLENIQDMDAKGRRRPSPGERNGRARLTTEQVAAIRKDTRVQRLIAQEYGVSRSTIRDIRGGRSWSMIIDRHTEYDARISALAVRETV
jgi:HNH endonuclease